MPMVLPLELAIPAHSFQHWRLSHKRSFSRVRTGEVQ